MKKLLLSIALLMSGSAMYGGWASMPTKPTIPTMPTMPTKPTVPTVPGEGRPSFAREVLTGTSEQIKEHFQAIESRLNGFELRLKALESTAKLQ